MQIILHIFSLIGPINGDWSFGPFVFLYLGPDTVIPLVSVCGALIGFVLIFWRYIVGLGRKFYHLLTGGEDITAGSNIESEDDA